MNSVVLRPLRPASNLIVGVQVPKSLPAMVEATKPPKLPVTALVTAPAPPDTATATATAAEEADAAAATLVLEAATTA